MKYALKVSHEMARKLYELELELCFLYQRMDDSEEKEYLKEILEMYFPRRESRWLGIDDDISKIEISIIKFEKTKNYKNRKECRK